VVSSKSKAEIIVLAKREMARIRVDLPTYGRVVQNRNAEPTNDQRALSQHIVGWSFSGDDCAIV
jgi:hypothetical protein